MLIGMTLLISAGACSSDTKTESSEESEAVSASSDSSEDTTQESSDTAPVSRLLDQTFGKLWNNPTYWITADMIVETEVFGASDTSENTPAVSAYHYTVTVDRKQNRGMVNMTYPDQSNVHLIIKGGQLYDINDKDKVYSTQTFEEPLGTFGEAWTTKLSLGVTENLVYQSGGAANFTDPLTSETTEVTYETYCLSSVSSIASDDSSDGSDEMTFTYYFKDQQPIAEVMQTRQGKTTFLFREIYDSVSDQSVFLIDKEYQEIMSSSSL